GHCWTFLGEDGVSSAVEAAGGGPPVEPRRNTGPKVASGTTDSSRRFQSWVAGGKSSEPRRGERKDEAGATPSFVPDGTRFIFAPQPSDESLGYSRASLRDVESRPPKHVRPRRGEGWDEGSVCMPGKHVSKLMRN